MSSSSTRWDGAPATRVAIRASSDPSARLRHLVTGVFSEVSDEAIVTDPHLHVRSWNQAAERLYGWAEHEVLGRHLFDVVPVAGDDNDLNSAVRTLKETGRWFGEFNKPPATNSLVNVTASTTIVRDDRGESVAVVSVNRRALLDLPALSPNTDDEADIRRGLEGDEFDVHYQPVVALDTLRIISVEALVRWNHPAHGLLTPVRFIDAAERSGAISRTRASRFGKGLPPDGRMAPVRGRSRSSRLTFRPNNSLTRRCSRTSKRRSRRQGSTPRSLARSHRDCVGRGRRPGDRPARSTGRAGHPISD